MGTLARTLAVVALAGAAAGYGARALTVSCVAMTTPGYTPGSPAEVEWKDRALPRIFGFDPPEVLPRDEWATTTERTMSFHAPALWEEPPFQFETRALAHPGVRALAVYLPDHLTDGVVQGLAAANFGQRTAVVGVDRNYAVGGFIKPAAGWRWFVILVGPDQESAGKAAADVRGKM